MAFIAQSGERTTVNREVDRSKLSEGATSVAQGEQPVGEKIPCSNMDRGPQCGAAEARLAHNQ